MSQRCTAVWPGAARFAGAIVALLTALCSPLAAQTLFVDDAGRQVLLPATVARVFAAGFPAEVLLYTLVPEKLVGRNRVPEGDSVSFFPPAYRTPVFVRQLPDRDDASADAELLAIDPDVYVDYGTVDADYVAALEAITGRTRVPGVLLDGALSRIPQAYRRLGPAVGAGARGEFLATEAERLLETYRGALARPGAAPLRVYVACSADGWVPCLADETAGEQVAWLGALNVAGTRADAPRRPRTLDEVRAMAPDVVLVVAGAAAAQRLRADPAWQSVPAVAAGRVVAMPALPFAWGPRPPSVNRLIGLPFLASALTGRPLGAEFDTEVRRFFQAFYHLTLSDAQLSTLLAR